MFQFKKFSIAQDQCAMKVGTDGVLLGAWVQLPDVSSLRALDIGTGTGLIALMVAQRWEERTSSPETLKPETSEAYPCLIDAVEIDPLAAQQAKDNVQASLWAKQITIHHKSLAEYLNSFPQDRLPQYDLIVSNPPFYNATLKPDNGARAVARHKDSLPLAEIMRCASHTLVHQGRLALVYPMNYDQEVMAEAIATGLHPSRICNVLTKAGKPCKRRMAEFTTSDTQSSEQGCLFETLSIRDSEGDYTPEYKNLTLPFYTHLKR